MRDVGESPTHAPATKIAPLETLAIAFVALFSYIAYFEKPLAPNDRHDVWGIMPPAMQRLDVARRQAKHADKVRLFFQK